MKIIYKDLKKGIVKLVPENMDDLWHLYHIIEKGDLVRALTFRTAEQKTDKLRTKKADKKPMVLGIRVKDVDFHQFSDRLRIHGIIEEGPQDLGSHHTINLKAGEFKDLTIEKEKWKVGQLKRLDEAVRTRGKHDIMFVSMDDEEAMVGILRNSGIQILAEIESGKSGKLYESKEYEREYFGKIIGVLKNAKDKDMALLIVGPGFAKDKFYSYGKEIAPELFSNAFIHGTGNSGISGVYEAMKGGAAEKIGKENRVVKETKLVERLLEEISKDGLATYGREEVIKAIKSGAVSHLLIIDKLARTDIGEDILSLAKEYGSDFTIVNSSHEAGKKLEGLGGIAAILRFLLE